MPLSKRARQTQAAKLKRMATKTNTGPRAYLPVTDPAPKPIDAQPINGIRIPAPVDRLNLTQGPKKRKRVSSLTIETSRKAPRSDLAVLRIAEPSVIKIEVKWHAVAEFFEARGKGGGIVKNEIANAIAKRYDVTGETLRDWARRVDSGQSLMRDDGSGY